MTRPLLVSPTCVLADHRSNCDEDATGDRFIIEDGIVGHGADGFVRIAVDQLNGNRVAVKTITHKRNRTKHASAIRNEIELMDSVCHPNVAKFIARWSDHEGTHIVIEYCGAELFDSIIHHGPFAEHKALSVAYQLLSAVSALEMEGITHRDIKPENCGLLPTGEIKLFDFGLACRHKGKPMHRTCGSLAYLAPEVLQGHYYGSSCDVWSVGIILYILLCGYPLFECESAEQVAQFFRWYSSDAGNDMLGFKCNAWNDVSAETKQLLRCMLQPDPNKRLSAVEALKHKCFQGTEWCRNQSNHVLVDTEETAVSSHRKRTRSDSDSYSNIFFGTPRLVALCSSPDYVAYPYPWLWPSADCDVDADVDLASFRTKIGLKLK